MRYLVYTYEGANISMLYDPSSYSVTDNNMLTLQVPENKY